MLKNLKRNLYLIRTFWKRHKIYLSRNKYYQKHLTVNKILDFTESCLNISEELKADIYINHGVQSLSSAMALAKKNGQENNVICDVVDIPDFDKRNYPLDWSKASIELMNDITETNLKRCKSLFTVSPSLRNEIKKYNDIVEFIPNYRVNKSFKPNTQLRTYLKIPSEDKVILVPNNISSKLENVINSLEFLPNNYHIVVLGKIHPARYKESIFNFLKEKPFKERVHIIKPVKYENFPAYASSADVGLICLDIERRNSLLSLPNRLFDIMAAGLPVISQKKFFDIQDFINKNNNGVIIEDCKPESWAKGILKAIDNHRKYTDNSINSDRKYNWSICESKLNNIFSSYKSVTILGAKDLTANQRTIRISESLSKMGLDVNICYLSSNVEKISKNSKIKFFPIEKKL